MAARFALVGVAGAMATAAGLTGWPQGESERAAKACFDAWLAARGGAGNGEVAAIVIARCGPLKCTGRGLPGGIVGQMTTTLKRCIGSLC